MFSQIHLRHLAGGTGLWLALAATAGAQATAVHPAAARAWRIDRPTDALVWTAHGAPVDQSAVVPPTGQVLGQLVSPPVAPRVQSAHRTPEESFAARVELDLATLDALAFEGPHRVGLPLPEGGSLELVLQTLESRGPTRFTWFGQIAGVANSLVILVRHDDALRVVVTNANAHGRRLDVRGSPDGHLLTETTDAPEGCGGALELPASEEPSDPSSGSGGVARGGSAADPTNVIDVLVVATDQARSAYGSAGAFVADAYAMLADTNFRVSTSGGAWSYRLCAAPWTLIAGYSERADYPSDLRELTRENGYEWRDGDGNLLYTNTDSLTDVIQDQRDTWRPDLVALVRSNTAGGAAGIGWRPSTPGIGSGYSVNYMGSAASAVVAHEIGHNMGACHNATSSAPSCSSPFTPTPRGFSATADVPDGICGGCEDTEFYTTMAYQSDSSVSNHIRVQRYSVMGLMATLNGSFGSDTVNLWDSESQAMLTMNAARPLVSANNVAVTQIWAEAGAGGFHNGTWQDPMATIQTAAPLAGGTPAEAIVRARAGIYGETAANGGTPVVLSDACTIVPEGGVVLVQ